MQKKALNFFLHLIYYGTYAGKRHHDSVHAVCSLCAQDIYAGETLWYRNGVTVCADCFPRFAREALRSFEYISGEASTL